jgi:hypothetical protein
MWMKANLVVSCPAKMKVGISAQNPFSSTGERHGHQEAKRSSNNLNIAQLLAVRNLVGHVRLDQDRKQIAPRSRTLRSTRAQRSSTLRKQLKPNINHSPARFLDLGTDRRSLPKRKSTQSPRNTRTEDEIRTRRPIIGIEFWKNRTAICLGVSRVWRFPSTRTSSFGSPLGSKALNW